MLTPYFSGLAPSPASAAGLDQTCELTATRFDADTVNVLDTKTQEVVARIKASGINIIGNYIFGLPEDTSDTMQDTLDLALDERHHLGARLHARALLGQHELAAGEIPARLAQQHRELDRENHVTVDVLVETVVASRFVAQQQRRRARLHGLVAAREEIAVLLRPPGIPGRRNSWNSQVMPSAPGARPRRKAAGRRSPRCRALPSMPSGSSGPAVPAICGADDDDHL